MKNKKALITGITGQDGSLLARLLLHEGIQVSGTFRRGSGNNFWRLNEMEILDSLSLHEHTIGGNPMDLTRIVNQNFDYIFHLAGDSFTQDSFRHPYQTINTNVSGNLEILEAVKQNSQETKVFIANSSEIYGNNKKVDLLIHEDAVRNPLNPYGISQSAILDLARYFRNVHGLFVSVGILFNHESEFRSPQFLSRKVSYGLAELKISDSKPIKLGNLDSSRDWGSAEDYVRAFRTILDADSPSDYILATGRSISVREIITVACVELGFNPEFIGSGISEKCIDSITGKVLIEVSTDFFRELDTPCLIGSTKKIEHELGWKPTRSIEDLIAHMCSIDLSRIKKLNSRKF